MTSTWWLYTGLPVLLIYALTAAVVRFGPARLSGQTLALLHFGALLLSPVLMNAPDASQAKPGAWPFSAALLLSGVAVAAAAVHFLRHHRRLPLLGNLYFGLWTVAPLLCLLISLVLTYR